MSLESIQYLQQHAAFPRDQVIDAFVAELKNKYKDQMSAVVFYGSCIRTKEYDNAVLDFYVVVDSYQYAHTSRWHAFLNYLLPPNVYFMQVQSNGESYRAKYAVVTHDILQKRVSEKAFHPYFWARFSQPIAIVYSRRKEDLLNIVNAQWQSAKTLYRKTCFVSQFAEVSKSFWLHSFGLTYRAELRAESKDRAEVIYTASQDYYDRVFEFLKLEQNTCSSNSFFWFLRSVYGKIISIARLLKATLTFDGGVDYIAWKIQRHTGEEIRVTDKLRSHPLVVLLALTF